MACSCALALVANSRAAGRCLEAPSRSTACFAPLGPRDPDFFSDCVSGKLVGQLSHAATALDATAAQNKWVPAAPRPLPRRPLPRRAATDICGRPQVTARRRSSGGSSALDGASTGTILMRCAAACASRGRPRRRRFCCFGRPRRRGSARPTRRRLPTAQAALCRRPADPPSVAHASSSHGARRTPACSPTLLACSGTR